MGEMAVRIRDELGVEVVAQDISPRMVESTRAAGIAAEIGDVESLPYPDESFDCVVANWVLYHLPDLALGVREVARVLRPGGRLVAATLGDGNMRELWELIGGTATSGLSFSCANGASVLEPVFTRVERQAGGRADELSRPRVDPALRRRDDDALAPRGQRARARRPVHGELRRTASSSRRSRREAERPGDGCSGVRERGAAARTARRVPLLRGARRARPRGRGSPGGTSGARARGRLRPRGGRAEDRRERRGGRGGRRLGADGRARSRARRRRAGRRRPGAAPSRTGPSTARARGLDALPRPRRRPRARRARSGARARAADSWPSRTGASTSGAARPASAGSSSRHVFATPDGARAAGRQLRARSRSATP